MVQGLVLKDLLSHPEDLLSHPETDPTVYEGKATTLVDAPTESHELALEAARGNNPDHGTGRAQVAHGQEVLDLGWNERKEHIDSPLVGGLSNEEVWLLVRRFNKVKVLQRLESEIQADCDVANVPCERDSNGSSRRTGHEHCR